MVCRRQVPGVHDFSYAVLRGMVRLAAGKQTVNWERARRG